GSHVPTTAFAGTYADFIAQQGRRADSVDLILPLANELGVRASIEGNFPPVQVYGTTVDWIANYHRHIPLVDDCSLCRFPLEDTPIQTVCSTARVETSTEEVVDAA